MSHQPPRRPPYFDWPLDRWKIGLALLLWLALILFPPAPEPPSNPQGASPVARPGQRPLVGASVQSEPVAAVPPPAAPLVSPLEQPRAENPSPQSTNPLTMRIWEPGRTPLRNSTPLFYGQTAANGLVEILLEGRRYQVQADAAGYWQFAPSAPLPVGMTWVQARQVEADGALLSSTLSQMVLVGADATPISAPSSLVPLTERGSPVEQLSALSGIGPAGARLIFYMQTGADGDALPVGESVVGRDGLWRWDFPPHLTAGQQVLWIVVVDDAGKALSRSWPLEANFAPQTKVPLLDSTPITQ